MRPRQLSLILVALVIAAPVSGCGDENGSNGPDGAGGSTNDTSGASAGAGSGASGGAVTTSALGKAEFVKRANARCVRNREAREEAALAYTNRAEGESINQFYAKVLREAYIPRIENQMAMLRELGAPRGDARQIEGFISAVEELIDVIEREGPSARAKINRGITQIDKLATKYGFDECGFN